MKKVLMLVYAFPPVMKGGILRKVKFVKYLHSFGWKSIVLAVKSEGFPFHDKTMLNDLPKDIKIIRTFSFEPSRLYKRMKKIFKRKNNASGLGFKENIPKQQVSLIGKLKDLLYKLIFIPDNRVGWLPCVLLKGLKIIKDEKVDVIFSTSPPATCHLGAYILKKLTGCLWVADFRDPWTANAFYAYHGQFRGKIDKYLERKILFSCDKIIANTPGNKEKLISKFNVHPEKIVVITNGFDPADFPQEVVKKKNDKFVIMHSGSLYTTEPLKGFFEAINKLCIEKPELKDNIEVIFRGGFEAKGQRELKQLKLPEIVCFEETLPYRENLQNLLQCDLLLVCLFFKRINSVPAKTYEYLYTQKPILALVREGDCADIIKKTKTGVVVNPDDVDQIAAEVYNFYKMWEKGEQSITPNWDLIKQFESKYLTEKLAQVFEECLKTKRARTKRD